MNIVGLDVSKSSVSCCILTQQPKEPREFYYECDFFHFAATTKGIKDLLELKPDIAIIEPTGVNYSKIWVENLTRAGIQVRFVGHKELRNYRMHQLQLPDKDDDADALALACYYFDYQNQTSRFLRIRDPIIAEIRQMALRLGHLNRVQSPIINRIRQDLSWQFPEVALRRTIASNGSPPALWQWLAGEKVSKHYERLYANTVGLGVTNTVKYHAQRLCSLYREEIEIEANLKKLMQNPDFEQYQKIFSKFNFGNRLQALLLSQIYPFECFLGEDKQPIIKVSKGRVSGKPTQKHLSERKFQKTLGVAPSLESSGDSHRHKVRDGSSLCRKSLWLWVFSAIEPRLVRPKCKYGKELGNYLDDQKSAGYPPQLARSRTMSKAVKLLFREFVGAFCK